MKTEDKIEKCSFCEKSINIETDPFDVLEVLGYYIYKCEECR